MSERVVLTDNLLFGAGDLATLVGQRGPGQPSVTKL